VYVITLCTVVGAPCEESSFRPEVWLTVADACPRALANMFGKMKAQGRSAMAGRAPARAEPRTTAFGWMRQRFAASLETVRAPRRVAGAGEGAGGGRQAGGGKPARGQSGWRARARAPAAAPARADDERGRIFLRSVGVPGSAAGRGQRTKPCGAPSAQGERLLLADVLSRHGVRHGILRPGSNGHGLYAGLGLLIALERLQRERLLFRGRALRGAGSREGPRLDAVPPPTPRVQHSSCPRGHPPTTRSLHAAPNPPQAGSTNL
jgi:hypothetical protein